MVLSVLLCCLVRAWPFQDADVQDREEAMQARARSRFPSSLYLVAVGESSRSRDDAELRARAGVAEQLGLSVISSLTTRMEEHRHDDKGDLSSQVVWEARKEARFDNAQLIRCEPALRTGDGWTVVAWLPRTEAVGGLVRQYEDSARRFRERASEALGAPGLEGFVAPWREAVRLGRWLQQHEARTASLARDLGGSGAAAIPTYAQDMERLRALEEERGRRMAAIGIAVVGDTLGGFRRRVETRMREVGARLVPAGSAWELALGWERSEAESPIGEIRSCRVVAHLALWHGGGVVASRTAAGAAGEGYAVRDAAKACVLAQARADASGIESELDEVLRSAFPIP